MRWKEIISETTSQEENLVQNYRRRRSEIKNLNQDIQVFSRPGQTVFYIIQQDKPVGYVSCWDHHVDGETYCQINSTFITQPLQRTGLAYKLYTSILDAGYILESDWERSPGAEALWAKLSRDSKYDIQPGEDDRFIARKA